MDEVSELGDYEEDYDDQYEQRYANELEMMGHNEGEIDFEVLERKPSVKELDTNLLQDVLKKKFPLTSKDNNNSCHNLNSGSIAVKRTLVESNAFVDDGDILSYSSDESCEETVQAAFPKKQKIEDINLDAVDNTKLAKLLKSLKSDDLTTDQVYNDLKRKRVFHRPLFGNESLNVTSTEGERVFVKLHPDEEDRFKTELTRWQSNSSMGGLNLLTVPFQNLKADVAEKRYTRHRSETLASNAPRNVNEVIGGKKAFDLWVEKYAPKQYTELLSDDGTNRLLLKWLKLWDNIAFPNSKKDMLKSSEKEVLFRKKPPFSKEKNFMNKFQRYDVENELVLDNKGRPKRKIALLCGNPGLGKTTLAHVIAQHAGYNVVEMNASDDRSPELFLNKIESTTQMKAVIGTGKRPNCLVIDEIDGAPVQAINILLDLIKFTENNGGVKKKKKRNKKEFLINRPIICICNDQYVPALRQLRGIAFTVQFPLTLGSRLANRLMNIAHSESLRIDMGALLFLADKTENDIRSCLNTLQFIKDRSKEFKPEDLKDIEVGQKDMKKGVRAILTDVFQLPRSKKKLYGTRSATVINPKTSASARFYYMLHLVSGNSEFEKVMQGLFDHYLNAKTKDPYFESVKHGCDWLIFADSLEQQIGRHQDFVLRRYSTFLPVAFHMYFARATAPKIQYTNISYENFQKTSHNIQTFELMKNGMHPNIRRYCLQRLALLELIPYLFMITSPSLRPINTRLYSESEKQMFGSLIEVMISYNLTYRQERNPEEQYTYLLEPNIEELTTFTGLPQHRHLPYATKQLIAREVDIEKMRRTEKLTKAAQEMNKPVMVPSNSSKLDINVVKSQQLHPKRIAGKEEKQHVDFFGRIVKDAPKHNEKQTSITTQRSIIDKTVWFRFNEGYTNAVRMPVKVKEFL